MKKLSTLIVFAIIANLITFSFYFYAAGKPGGSGLPLVFTLTFPLVWVITLIIAIVLIIRGRKVIFKKRILKCTIPVLLFNTPVPFLVVFFILNPPFAIHQAESGYYPKNGFTIKDEEWNYPNGMPAVNKYFKLNSEQYQDAADADFKKDSIWVYFDTSGDTTKLEWYKNGRLVKIDNTKRRAKH